MIMASQLVTNCRFFGVEKIVIFLSGSFTNKVFILVRIIYWPVAARSLDTIFNKVGLNFERIYVQSTHKNGITKCDNFPNFRTLYPPDSDCSLTH